MKLIDAAIVKMNFFIVVVFRNDLNRKSALQATRHLVKAMVALRSIKS